MHDGGTRIDRPRLERRAAACPLPSLWPVAMVDVPSFQGVPWAAFALTGLLCLTIAACLGAARWVRRTGSRMGEAASQRWNLVFQLIGVGLLACFLLGFWWTIPAAWAVLLVAATLFVRGRDPSLPDSRKIFVREGLRNLVTELREHTVPWSHNRQASRPLTLKEQWSQLVGSWRERLSGGPGKAAPGKSGKRTAVAKKPAGGQAADTFTFLKKDGTTVMSIPLGGKATAKVSAHVLKTQQLLLAAIRSEADKLLFEQDDKGCVVRAGIEGAAKDLEKLSADDGRGVISTLKVMADMAGTEPNRAQRGAFAVLLRGVRHQIDVSTAAAAGGERLALRLQQPTQGVSRSGLDALGFRPKVLAQFREAICRPYGLLLVVGPEGSGRTTTLYAAIRELDAKKRKITTVENPIAGRLDDVTQINVDTASGAAVASVLQMVLRQDPDVLLVGSLGDTKTAELACQAALTGHFVLTSFEARDTIDAVIQLITMGLEPMLVQTAVTAVLAQRLARRLCPACRVPCDPPEALLRKFNLKPGAVKHIYKEKGCEKCGGTGFQGLVAIHELLVMNDQIRRLITADPSAHDLKAAAVLNGTLTLQIDGLTKVIHGETTVNEILHVTG